MPAACPTSRCPAWSWHMTGNEPAGLLSELEFQQQGQGRGSRPGPPAVGVRPRGPQHPLPLPCTSSPFAHFPICHPFPFGGWGDGDAFVLLFSPAPICLNPSLALQPHPCPLGDSVLMAAEKHRLAPWGLHQALWRGFWTYLCMLCQT